MKHINYRKLLSVSLAVFAAGATVLAGIPASATPTTETSTLAGYPLEFTRVIHDAAQAAALSALPNRLYVIPVLGGQALSFDLGLNPRGTISGISGLGTQAFDQNNNIVATTSCVGVNSGQANCMQIAIAGMTATGENFGLTVNKTINLDSFGGIDNHEILPDPTGNGYWATQYEQIPCDTNVALCGANRPASITTALDCRVVRFDDTGKLTFEWRASQNLPMSQLRLAKWAASPIGLYQNEVADPYHCNSVSVSPDGKKVLVSMRHMDSIYAIDIASGKVDWKIGGNTWKGKSLKIGGKYIADILGGQHDARIQPNGNISVFDNGSGLARPGRGLIFKVHANTHRAKLVAVMSDPLRALSRCTGSFRPALNYAYWVAEWGCSTSGATVFTASGKPVVSSFYPRSAINKPYIYAQWDYIATSFGYRGLVIPAALTPSAG